MVATVEALMVYNYDKKKIPFSSHVDVLFIERDGTHLRIKISRFVQDP